MILPIVAYGSPVLRKETEEIEEGSDINELISNMFDTMYASSGVGLAGPQIGESLRIFIVDASTFSDPEEGEKASIELLRLKDFKKVFINPIIEAEIGKEWPFSEGCLSIVNFPKYPSSIFPTFLSLTIILRSCSKPIGLV